MNKIETSPNAFSPIWCAAVTTRLLSSEAIHRNRLSDAFRGSSGLQVVFTRKAKLCLQSDFPDLYEFFARVANPESNAFFMNVLITSGKFEVRRHIDCSLNPYLLKNTTPSRVSVLYVQAPKTMDGGELEVVCDSSDVQRIAPSTGLLVQFEGNLVHGVCKGQSALERISLVMEEYELEHTLLASIPNYTLAPQSTVPAINVQSSLKKVRNFLGTLTEEEYEKLKEMLAKQNSK